MGARDYATKITTNLLIKLFNKNLLFVSVAESERKKGIRYGDSFDVLAKEILNEVKSIPPRTMSESRLHRGKKDGERASKQAIVANDSSPIWNIINIMVIVK